MGSLWNKHAELINQWNRTVGNLQIRLTDQSELHITKNTSIYSSLIISKQDALLLVQYIKDLTDAEL